ncbi:hypothetical protein A2Z33_00930 [Candidatus Gottesmanbacteria bacterium RBG_16_52_11]|uniref:Uncharacterized protein n=1 Tax=Candidatus Gottesmanbacteria bacterium RBG_16_52_11 TaxID=1798374 RepID=A0A1F5YNN8_9BACT|nr:MAG: hypothetical protein A2Z33_00930 [Candidatus Gottesmanbacteria bacterium RBG_16_52_11]
MSTENPKQKTDPAFVPLEAETAPPPQQIPETPLPAVKPLTPVRKGMTAWSILAISIIALSLFGLGILISARFLVKPPAVVPQPTGIPVTPTPVREINPIATTSAFLDLESAVNQLTGAVSSYSPQDSAAAPPVLDLPLGFSKR